MAANEENSPSISFRRGASDDSYAVFSLFEETLADLSRRLGIGWSTSWDEPDKLAEIDQAILEHRRDDDHAWLLADRQGYLYYRAGRLVMVT